MGIYKSKQHSKVKYLGCLLNKTMFENAAALNVINKLNNKLKFLHHKNLHQHWGAYFVMRSYSPILIMYVLSGIQI